MKKASLIIALSLVVITLLSTSFFKTPYYQLYTVQSELKQGNTTPLLQMIHKEKLLASLQSFYTKQSSASKNKNLFHQMKSGFVVLFLPRLLEFALAQYINIHGQGTIKEHKTVLRLESLAKPFFKDIDFNEISVRPMGFSVFSLYLIIIGKEPKTISLTLTKESKEWLITHAEIN